MGPPAGQQRGHGASKAGQAQNDKRLDECDYDVDVTPRSRAQTHVAMRMVGEGTIYLRYKQLLRSVIHAFRIQQDGFAPTTLVIKAPARADDREFAADCNIPDIQAELVQNFAAQRL